MDRASCAFIEDSLPKATPGSYTDKQVRSRQESNERVPIMFVSIDGTGDPSPGRYSE